MFNDTDRGQVGIGTLIVFIAMVLVAAIAAGVLINTAGLLQAQAEATGEESAEQVSDRVQIVSVSGDDGDDFEGISASDDGEINALQVSVRRAPGSGDIDLSNVVVEAFANGESATLTAGDAETTGEFGIEDIDVTTAETLSDNSDRSSLIIDLADDVASLSEGDSVSLTVTSAAGGTAFVEKRAPSTITNGETYRL